MTNQTATPRDDRGRVDYLRGKNDCVPVAVAHCMVGMRDYGISQDAPTAQKVEHFKDLYDMVYQKLETDQGYSIRDRGSNRTHWHRLVARLGFQKVNLTGTGWTIEDVARRYRNHRIIAKTQRHVTAVINGRVIDEKKQVNNRRPTTIFIAPAD